ncbi:oligosaccharide flippase family protein, partial [candidate division KSB1 bacterium]|nr:oligosaccharide flippase family protein [candidate division KSB1 bacterium]
MPALLSKLFKNSAYLLVMNLGMLAALFVFSVLLARSLGKEALGLYTLFTATLMPFAYFVDLGQSTSLVQ